MAGSLRSCGVDEAGRGCLAGDVFAAAVILDPVRPIEGLADSKQLTPRRRELLATQIRERALAWCVARASVAEIDAINILQASLLAMSRAVAGLAVRPGQIVVDGLYVPAGLPTGVRARAVVDGDQLITEISAASILAKTARDAVMRAVHEQFPQYDFARHKGYGTPAHLRALAAHGPCPLHRRSFAPVRACGAQVQLAW